MERRGGAEQTLRCYLIMSESKVKREEKTLILSKLVKMWHHLLDTQICRAAHVCVCQCVCVWGRGGQISCVWPADL